MTENAQNVAQRDVQFAPYDNEQITAQDVIDAMRLALMGQKDWAEKARLVSVLIELAPETDSNRGMALLLRLISEATFSVEASS